MDLALALGIPFVVCPCCVFPSKFPHRRLPDGGPVTDNAALCAFIKAKHPAIRTATLPFQSESGTARNVVLYTMPGDVVV